MSDDVSKAVGAGVVLLGCKLREWRDYAALDSITARFQTADGVLEITCDAENRVWAGGIELTAAVEAHGLGNGAA